MTGFRGVLIGALTLIAIQTIVSTSGAANRTAGFFHDVAAFIDKFVDPTEPFFHDHSKPHAQPTATTTSATYTPPAAPPPGTVPPARTPAPATPPTTTYV